MIEGLLPIGSVVQLKESTKRVMIIGVCQKAVDTELVYDYAGCLFPEGYLDPNKLFLFHQERIEQLISIGYQDEEQLEFKKKADLIIKDIKDKEIK